MKGHLGHAFLTFCLLLSLLWIGAMSVLPGSRLVRAQVSSEKISSYRVDGAPNYDAPGSESFWKAISWTTIPLAASVPPGGGRTQNLLVKSANDGYNIYVLLRWNDPVGPSFGSGSEIYRASNGTLVPLNPEDTANVKQLFYNSTYYYQDRVATLWFLENSTERQQSPKMELGSNGAITGGAAEIWHWQSVPTDNDPNDTDFPGGYTNPSGSPIFPPDDLSYAESDYVNTTGYFVVSGSFGADSPNLDPSANPYIVHVGNAFSNTDKTWTVEMVRTYTTSDATPYTVQLSQGSSYYIAFAVWNGKMGESAHIKSVSQWYSLTLNNEQASSTSTPLSGGVDTTLGAALGLGLLLVGGIIGTILRPKGKDAWDNE